jgi:hypothetical protein
LATSLTVRRRGCGTFVILPFLSSCTARSSADQVSSIDKQRYGFF